MKPRAAFNRKCKKVVVKQVILFKIIFLCSVVSTCDLFSSLRVKKVHRLAQLPAGQPSNKKIKIENQPAVQQHSYSMCNYIPSLRNFPHDVWRIISSYVTIHGFINHAIALSNPARMIGVDVKTQGKIVQTALGTRGTIALRTSRGFVQVHSPENKKILKFRVPYSPQCTLELSADEQLVHVSKPEQVWDLKTQKQMPHTDFEKHKAEKEILHISSKGTELVYANQEQLITIKGLPQGHQAAIDTAENMHRVIVIPSNHARQHKRRGVWVYDQRTGNKILDFAGQCVRTDCFENGGPLITESNNQDLVWNNERAIFRIPHKLTDTKINSTQDILIGTNEDGSEIKICNIGHFSAATFTPDQTIFLWVLDAYKARNKINSMTLSSLVKFCDDPSITLAEAQRVYQTFNPAIKTALINTYGIVEDQMITD